MYHDPEARKEMIENASDFRKYMSTLAVSQPAATGSLCFRFPSRLCFSILEKCIAFSAQKLALAFHFSPFPVDALNAMFA